MKKKKRTAHIFVSFLFLSVSLLCNSTIHAQNSTVNLNYKDASFVEVINEFRKQTGVKFMYNLEKVKDKRCKDLTVKNIPTKRAIDIVLKELSWSKSNRKNHRQKEPSKEPYLMRLEEPFPE